jgi:ABC-type transporter Mla MlaB component
MAHNILIETKTGADKTSAEIRISGEVTLQNSKYIAEQIQSAIAPYSTIHIIVTNETAIDVSCIQLLLAAQKTNDKQITIETKLTEANQTLIRTAGFTL